MAIVYIPHAALRMQQRGISQQQVGETLNNPEFALPARRGRRAAFRRYGSHYLKVIYENNPPNKVVITAEWSQGVS